MSLATAGSWGALTPALSQRTLNVLRSRLNLDGMTPVQASTIPLFMSNKDVSVEACTGSGKTLAFVIPIMEILLKREIVEKKDVCAIVIAPTRELAIQIHSVVQPFLEAATENMIDDDDGVDGDDEDTSSNDADSHNDDNNKNKKKRKVVTPTHGQKRRRKNNDDVETVAAAAAVTHTAVVTADDGSCGRHFSSLLLIGGKNARTNDIKEFRQKGANIVIATPGRLKDFMDTVDDFRGGLKKLEVLVLDEADRLLDLGFEKTITQIFSKLPKQRRTGLFSATQTKEVMDLARAGLRNPVQVSVAVTHASDQQQQQPKGGRKQKNADTTRSTPASLTNYYCLCESNEKISYLVSFLLAHPTEKVMVYFLTCACVDFFWKALSSLEVLKKHKIFSLHGNVPQNKRSETFQRFVNAGQAKDGSGPVGSVLLATDVAARGLDIPDVDWIIQMDPPQDPKAYVHRIGRTARMGKLGNALVFLLPSEDTYIEYLSVKQVPVTSYPLMDELKQFSDGGQDIPSLVRAMILKDRSMMDKSILAYVSYVAAYKQHHCKYIFTFAQLDLTRLGRGFSLLQLPKMPELKGKQGTFDSIDRAVIERIPYADKQRERGRQVKLKEEREKGGNFEGSALKKNDAWSEKRKYEDKRRLRKEKKQRKREARRRGEEGMIKAKDHEIDFNEWQDLARECKKMRKGTSAKKRRKKLSAEDASRELEEEERRELAKSK